jgi:hypothetical protein
MTKTAPLNRRMDKLKRHAHYHGRSTRRHVQQLVAEHGTPEAVAALFGVRAAYVRDIMDGKLKHRSKLAQMADAVGMDTLPYVLAKVDRYGSASAAARKLGVTPTAIYHHLRDAGVIARQRTPIPVYAKRTMYRMLADGFRPKAIHEATGINIGTIYHYAHVYRRFKAKRRGIRMFEEAMRNDE